MGDDDQQEISGSPEVKAELGVEADDGVRFRGDARCNNTTGGCEFRYTPTGERGELEFKIESGTKNVRTG